MENTTSNIYCLIKNGIWSPIALLRTRWLYFWPRYSFNDDFLLYLLSFIWMTWTCCKKKETKFGNDLYRYRWVRIWNKLSKYHEDSKYDSNDCSNSIFQKCSCIQNWHISMQFSLYAILSYLIPIHISEVDIRL